jgi:hypothetical protein
MPLGKCHFGKLAVSFWLQVPRKENKKEKKERRHLVFFFRICNL